MNKYLLYSHLQKTFQSIRKETREHLYISFHRAYILSMVLLIILWILYVWMLNASANSGYQMTRIESVRREKQQEKHFLRAQIAKQESKSELDKYDDRMINMRPENISYVQIEK
jgi:hypothetical protein